MGNFHSLIIAGLGSVGSSLVLLGREHLASYDQVFLVDHDEQRLPPLRRNGYHLRPGRLDDPRFLESLLRSCRKPALLVNLCAETNTFRIRRQLAGHDLAYLDSSASCTDDPDQHRFSSLMPHTLQPVASCLPHWLCWGINPGLVELLSRRLIHDFADPRGRYAVTIFEYDQLHAPEQPELAAVGWCPAALIEEVMLAPTLTVRDGRPWEATSAGAMATLASWQGEAVPSRLVAHEDIWNLSLVEQVQHARFVYALAPRIMSLLAGPVAEAKRLLTIPAPEVPVAGLERVAVQVTHLGRGQSRSVVWETDHRLVWQRFGVNGVQYQTARSLLFAMTLMQHTPYGRLAGTFCASTLPIASQDWPMLEEFLLSQDIVWQDADQLCLTAESWPTDREGEN